MTFLFLQIRQKRKTREFIQIDLAGAGAEREIIAGITKP